MHDWLGIALFAIGIGLIGYGVVKRRRRKQTVLPAGSIRPEFVGMSAFVRPLLLWTIGFFFVETTLHYFMLGGRGIMSPLDFAGILFLLAAFFAYVKLAIIPPALAPEP